jgi:hypothetical protein
LFTGWLKNLPKHMWVMVGGRFSRGELKSLSNVTWVARGGISAVDGTTTFRGFSKKNFVVLETLKVNLFSSKVTNTL